MIVEIHWERNEVEDSLRLSASSEEEMRGKIASAMKARGLDAEKHGMWSQVIEE